MSFKTEAIQFKCGEQSIWVERDFQNGGGEITIHEKEYSSKWIIIESDEAMCELGKTIMMLWIQKGDNDV